MEGRRGEIGGGEQPRAMRRPAARIAAVVLAAMSAGCAATKQDFATGSLNRELERGGATVAQAERKFELQKVAFLAEDLPLCIAYRMPPSGPEINLSFKSALRELARKPEAERAAVTTAHVFHARFGKDTGGSFPATTMLEMTQLLKQSFSGIETRYRPVAAKEFRGVATCGAKDTVFVDVERLTFYRQSMPSDLTWSGGIHIADVLFIRLESAPAANTASERQKRETSKGPQDG